MSLLTQEWQRQHEQLKTSYAAVKAGMVLYIKTRANQIKSKDVIKVSASGYEYTFWVVTDRSVRPAFSLPYNGLHLSLVAIKDMTTNQVYRGGI